MDFDETLSTMCTCAWSNTNCNSNISKYYSENHFKYFFYFILQTCNQLLCMWWWWPGKDGRYTSKVYFAVYNILTVPTKEVLSKLIQKLFNITSFLRYKGKSKYTAFKLVKKETPVDESVSLKIPEHCSTTCNSSSIQIVVQTEFCINGNSVQHCILFKENGNCTVKILNRDINFMFPIKYNQNTIDGIRYVLETFRICKGVKRNCRKSTGK